MDARRRLRLIIDPPRDGAWNMAADEWLLHSTSEAGGGCLRLYRWDPATLSLGYFQSREECSSHRLGNGLPLVRRLSGGGAILHHHEWTYALALPIEHPLAQDRLGLYLAVHRTLLEWLTGLGFSARIFPPEESRPSDAACGSLAGRPVTTSESQAMESRSPTCDAGVARPNGKPPFLCFLRRSPGDILVSSTDGSIETKIVGSAQRRARGAVLQHGSILFAQSPFAPELLGLRELNAISRCRSSGGTETSGQAAPSGTFSAADVLQHWERDFPGQWLPRLEQCLGCQWEPDDWPAQEVSAIERLRPRYEDPAWNRLPPPVRELSERQSRKLRPR